MRGFALLGMNEFTYDSSSQCGRQCRQPMQAAGRPANALRTMAVVFTPLGTAR